MNVVIYVVVFLAAVSKVSLSLPSQTLMIHDRSDGKAVVSDSPSYNRTRQARSAGSPLSGQQASYEQPREDAEAFNTLSQLLVKLITRKGMPYQSRSSIASRASGLTPEHRIKDRDYEGWMDFGRRSAEALEFS
ncbi:cholecystokinin-like isoform X2 [Corythoichthys intestinalis]|nr:cholecystokinin-like isoform X2 [Corythoichthys intestinalis]XP_057691139.1 cholecystokinin-like isoform X2 [Corythoichthys intestinalis]XP_057691140.1 cholecystokinin-like isoform X2 [Corythoichthys intestinalis]XP_057691141.1 cholecystokinin-like isoform X2 [Corythoichthys intestinalis]XP_057691142.1 cholecystokinin-like isoform X2 [Corythoichthys intestinalis]XP_057691143.1 cholecystokinin-like isoform X2 [Corythoichthys intestinalis]XP_057691144.1 cholecystokinin-like isoform X2 [Coryt